MRRLSIAFVLILVLCALTVGFGVQFNGSDVYPDAAAIDADYAAHVGERAHLWTEAVGTENGSLLVETEGLHLRVSDPSPAAVEIGDHVQIYGMLGPDRQFETENYHVQSAGGVWYMYGVSVVGIALAAVLFLRRWRIDLDHWRFVPRGGE
ncbi:hypothetical protein [Halobellus rubicundus]|uniref:DNA-binding protein n=1 Tax=Halobellus rubicundus TaxID=2996466 RepID=A0ABD5MDX7_9EURY